MRRRPILRLVARVEAAARRVGIDPDARPGHIAVILTNRSLCRGPWWTEHAITRVRPPRPALLWQAIEVFRQRAGEARAHAD